MGTKNHLLQCDDHFRWTSVIPDDAFVVGDKQRYKGSIESLNETFMCDIDLSFPENFVRAHEIVGLTNCVPWWKCMPHDSMKFHLERTLSQIRDSIQNVEKDRYYDRYLQNRRFLCSFSAAKIDENILNDRILDSKMDVNKASLISFKLKDGLLDKVVYKQNRTGRTSVLSGPKILTLKKEYRDIIISHSGDEGKIILIDLVSLEPRLALSIANVHESGDVYQKIAEKLGLNFEKISRDDLKKMLMGVMFGMSDLEKIKNVLPLEPTAFIKFIKKLFKIDEIESFLREEIEKNGFMRNFFGRKIFVDECEKKNLYSDYIQSSGVDASIESFTHFTDHIILDRAKPIFMIHDALMFDVDQSYTNDFLKQVEKGCKMRDFSVKFPMRAKILR